MPTNDNQSAWGFLLLDPQVNTLSDTVSTVVTDTVDTTIVRLAASAFHLLTGTPHSIHSNPAVMVGNHLNAAAPSFRVQGRPCAPQRRTGEGSRQ